MKPKLRYIDVIALDGGFLIRDPLGISENLLVSKEALLIMSLMDGSRDMLDIKADYFRLTGQIISDEDLMDFLKGLDDALFLENERFADALQYKRREMLTKGIRDMSHVGEVYPADAQACERFLKGPEIQEKLSPLGIMVPHMDIRIAKSTYWEAYGRIKGDKDLVVILGVSHYWHEMPFSVLPLDMKTPFGILKTNRALIEKLQSFYTFDITHDILSYRYEHSIEFASVYAKMIFPEAKALALIVSYGDEKSLKTLGENLLRVVEPFIHKTLFISSVDMSHVGKKFGDSLCYDPSFKDREYLKYLEDLEYEQAFELLEKDKNRTRIDGQYTNFVFAHILKRCGLTKGRILDYKVYYERLTDSKVSYASMVF